jgi:hypothetical protein
VAGARRSVRKTGPEVRLTSSSESSRPVASPQCSFLRQAASVSAYTSLGSYVLGPIGLVSAGPLGGVVGARTLLGVGVVWLLVSTTLVAALPAVRGADRV